MYLKMFRTFSHYVMATNYKFINLVVIQLNQTALLNCYQSQNAGCFYGSSTIPPLLISVEGEVVSFYTSDLSTHIHHHSMVLKKVIDFLIVRINQFTGFLYIMVVIIEHFQIMAYAGFVRHIIQMYAAPPWCSFSFLNNPEKIQLF